MATPTQMKRAHLWEQNYFPYVIAVGAMLLTLPSLGVGLQFDDYLLRQTVLNSPDVFTALQRSFVFMNGDPHQAQQLMDRGVFPWWAWPSGQVAFWRPLAALTHWLDFRFWPTNFWLMHAQNILWFGLVVLAVAKFYRQIMPSVWLASWAAGLYALDETHGFAVGWLSNRNGLMAMCFAILALKAHHRWREHRQGIAAVTAPLLFGLGLLSAEAALGALAYLLSYAWFLDRASARNRFLSVLPYGLLVLGWRWLYVAQGFGAEGTSYIDPLHEQWRYLLAVGERAPILFLAQWTLFPAELYPYLSINWAIVCWGSALLVCGGVGWLLLPLLRRDPLARFWAGGMGLALLPIASSLPANRLLFFVGLGAMGLLAQYFNSAAASKGYERLTINFLKFLHFGLAPLLLPFTAFSPILLGHIEPAIISLPNEPRLTSQTWVFVNAPSFFHVSYLPEIRALSNLSVPQRVRLLWGGLGAVQLRRVDAHTILVQPEGGYLTGFDAVFRGESRPLQLGQLISLAGLTLTVKDMVGHYPTMVSFQFEVPLEDSSLSWWSWQNGCYLPFTLPALGEQVTLPAIPVTVDLFKDCARPK